MDEGFCDLEVDKTDFELCEWSKTVQAVDSFVFCTPVTECVLLALPVVDAGNLTVVDLIEVELAVELLLLRLVENEELNEAEVEVDRREEDDRVNDTLLLTDEEPVSGEFQGPDRMGSDNEV